MKIVNREGHEIEFDQSQNRLLQKLYGNVLGRLRSKQRLWGVGNRE